MREYVLSICFNYYKRFEVIKPVLLSLLQSEDQRLQIVVYDDSFDTKMQILLSSIKDHRIKWVKPTEHAGMVRGMVECVSMGDGLYSMYATELEMFDYKKLSVFIDDLERNQNVGAGYSFSPWLSHDEYKVYKKGMEAVSKIAIQFQHPTGYFFKTKLYKGIDYLKYSDTEKYGNFPLDFLLGEMLIENDGMVYGSVWYGTNEYQLIISEEKSFTTKREDSAWFMPGGTEQLLKDAIEFIDCLPLNIMEKSKLILAQFDICARGVSASLKVILANDRLCKHYGMKSKYLGYRDYTYNLMHAYVFFCQSIPIKYHCLLLNIKALNIVRKYLMEEV